MNYMLAVWQNLASCWDQPHKTPLADNGYWLKFDPADAVKNMETVAVGALDEAALAEWFRQRIAE